MDESSAKRIFLSHKGIDKAKVIGFKKALEDKGYNPWLDKDEIKPGDCLSRSLVRGMIDSCAAVFFITPSFRDEGYLEDEVNYALRQKKERGDMFAIIPLLLDGAEESQVPEPIKGGDYVWAKPSSDFEALDLIIDSLPVRPEGPAPANEDLSTEAQKILKKAAHKGIILYRSNTYGSLDKIDIDGENVIPSDTDRRVVAKWVAALKSLIHLGLIERQIQGIYRVTDDGYKMADRLPEPLSPKAEELLEKTKNADGYINVRTVKTLKRLAIILVVGNKTLQGTEWDEARRELERLGLIRFLGDDGAQRRYEVV